MEEFLKGSNDAVAIFLYLLPGLLGLAIYDYLVEGPKREVFDRIVFALSLTLISTLCVNHFVSLLPTAAKPVAADNALTTISGMVGPRMGYITATCAVLAIVLAFLSNYAVLLRVARFFRMTYKTSSVDVWQDVFYKFRGYWVRITFADGRELVGWPEYFSSVGQPRELFIASATWWIKGDDDSIQSVEVVGAGVYVADFSTVTAIALLS